MAADTKIAAKKAQPKTLGLTVVADLWLWGALIIYAPRYLGIDGGWQYVFYALGFLSLVISLAGALTELGKLWGSEGLSYWGVSLVFLLPAAALYALVEYQYITDISGTIAKAAVLLLVALGGAMFFQGFPYLFWRPEGSAPKEGTVVQSKSEQRRINFEAIANLTVALLSLATAILALVAVLWPQASQTP